MFLHRLNPLSVALTALIALTSLAASPTAGAQPGPPPPGAPAQPSVPAVTTPPADEPQPAAPEPVPVEPAAAADEPAADGPGPLAGWAADLRETVASDMGRFYRRRRALRFGSVIAGAGALANSDADAEIQDWYRDEVRTPSGDDLAVDLERLGRSETIGMPLVAAGLLVGLGPEEGARAPVTWLRRTSRAYLVGTPTLLYLQTLTGGNRPSEGLGSDWEPFVGQNGVSGHAFTGAVPFLTLARQTDRWWLRALAVAASTAGGWAQFHADQHYFSQFALGWWLAWEATDAVAESEARLLGDEEPRVAVTPMPARGGGGVLVSLRF